MSGVHEHAREGLRTLKDRWTAFLQDRKLNTTQQREAIVDAFLKTHEHVSIDELLGKVRRRHPSVGYATVYRTLRLLVDSGLATERQFADGQTRYEVAGQHHDHLICIDCKQIFEFENDEIERLQDEMANKLGFRIVSHKLELYGRCPKGTGEGRCPYGH